MYGRILVGFVVLSSISKHNMWSYYGLVCNCCPSLNTIHDRIMVGIFVAVVSH